MHPADITAALRKAGSSQAKIAAQLGVTPATVHQVVWDRARSARVALAISRATQIPVSRLWPKVPYAKRLARAA